MKIKNLKNKIFILLFLAILAFPWIAGGLLRLFVPSVYSSVSEVSTEKREMQSIEWGNLLNTGESISGFIDDRIPFRYSLISIYRNWNNTIDSAYQSAADAIGALFYTPKTENTAVATVKSVKNVIISYVESEEVAAAKAEAEAAAENYYAPYVYEDVIMGRQGWLFLYGENEIECYQGTNLLDDATLQYYADLTNELQALCSAKGKEFYLFFAPNKSTVYSQYMPTYDIANDWKRIQRLKSYLDEYTSTAVILPTTELMAASNYNQVYYKYDTHWNPAGAFIGTQALYSAMGIETTEIAAWPTYTQDAEKYELYTLMGIPDSMVTHDDTELVINYRDDVTVNGLNLETECYVNRTTSNGANNKKLLVIGDSFRVGMMPYLSKDFTSCTFAHRDYMSQCSSDIKNADIIVIEAVERYDYEAFNTIQRVINVLK